jgi:hypothetical protein
MANPTPIFVVTYGGEQLPGYTQGFDPALSMRWHDDEIVGRDGYHAVAAGAGSRRINMEFLLKSDAGGSATGLQHYENLMAQYRLATKILTRDQAEKELFIHYTDRYFLAKAESISGPLEAGRVTGMNYNVGFVMQPWAYQHPESTETFTGNGTVVLEVGDSRRTYPTFSVTSDVTAFTATDDSGKSVVFERGEANGVLRIDCGAMTVIRPSNGANATQTMQNLNFGMYYNGTDGTYEITITDYAGSGVGVSVWARGRYEW